MNDFENIMFNDDEDFNFDFNSEVNESETKKATIETINGPFTGPHGLAEAAMIILGSISKKWGFSLINNKRTYWVRGDVALLSYNGFSSIKRHAILELGLVTNALGTTLVFNSGSMTSTAAIIHEITVSSDGSRFSVEAEEPALEGVAPEDHTEPTFFTVNFEVTDEDITDWD